MKAFFPISALIAMAVTSLCVSSCSTPPPAPEPTFTTSEKKKPKITIHNNSSRKIVVGVEGREKRFIPVPARSSRVVYLKSGVYKYAAAAHNTRTISGYKSFAPNRSYTWNFGVN